MTLSGHGIYVRFVGFDGKPPLGLPCMPPGDMRFEKNGDARTIYVWDFVRIGEAPVGCHTRMFRRLCVPDQMLFIQRLNLLRGRSRGDAIWDPPIWAKR